MHYRRRLGSGKKKKMSKTTMMTLFIIAIMVLSVLGFVITSDPQSANSFVYKDMEFRIDGGSIIADPGGRAMRFDTYPDNAVLINLDSGAVDLIKNAQMSYITFDPEMQGLVEMDYVRYDMANTFSSKYNIFLVSAVTKETPTYAFPVITCQNATSLVPVILFKPGNETRTDLEGNCLIMTAVDNYGYLRLKDRLIYGMEGILE